MSREQKRLMEDPDKLLREARSPLTALFRQVLVHQRVDAVNWNRRLTTYLNSHHSACPKNAKDIGQERNNFNRAIAKTEITFRTFHKAIHILGPVKYSMTLTLIDNKGVKHDITTPEYPNPFRDLYGLKGAVTGDHGPVTTVDPVTDIDDELDENDLAMQYEILDDAWQQLPDPEPAPTRPPIRVPKRRWNDRSK